MITKINPLGKNILIKRIKLSSNSIIISPGEIEKERTAEIIKIGQGKFTDQGKLIKSSLKEKQLVYLSKYGGQELGDDYLMITEDDILGTLEDSTF